MFALHDVHALKPVEEAMEPSAHASQVSMPDLDVNEPLAHAEHDAAPAPLYLPAPQDAHDACPAEP